jgi:lipoprotein-anchoring transpeptidase ErfK/SrfK
MLPTGTSAGAIPRLSLATFALFLSLDPAWSQADPAVATSSAVASVAKAPATLTPTQIEAASYSGGDLPAGQSALTAKVQVLLDRSGISPGVVDGWRGGMSESAVKAFQRRAGLPMTGQMDHAVWDLLQGYAAQPITMDYTITEEDAFGLVDNIPADYGEKAKMSSQGYTSILEKLAERFHMDEKFMVKLNPGTEFMPGATIHVTAPAKPIRATVTRIIVDKATRRVAAYDARGRLVADYPATVGSTETPSPHGNHVVDAVALNPTYTYNPQRNFKQGENDRVLIVPAGPNAPVGNVWIDLSQPTYGIHGTATPSKLFVNQSHGCVRLTNWDAWELAHMVKAKQTTVEFLDPGVSIADVTGGTPAAAAMPVVASVATINATRPPARGDRLPPQIAAIEPVPAAAVAAPSVDALAASLAQAGADVATTAMTNAAPTVVTPATPISHEPLAAAPATPAPLVDEPEYPSDALPDSLPNPGAGAAALPIPQAGQP